MNKSMHSHPHRIPLVLAALTVAGLISALLGDGVWDALSWVALLIPVALATIFAMRRAS